MPVRPQRARRLPVGAEILDGNSGTHFRVWAPRSNKVDVRFSGDPHAVGTQAEAVGLRPEADGYFAGHVPNALPGMFYKFELDTGLFPDPASRFQPLGPHGPSEIIEPRGFQWTDTRWRGPDMDGLVIYELHIGTFTTEGTWTAARERLTSLAELGIGLVEVMPVAEFAGRFGWGYDGVDLFAPTRLYGQPADFRAFVDRAHALGIAVILDVVYNHVGPDGNYLKEYSESYFTTRYPNEWGEAINFDGDGSGPVREFFIANAGYWIDEFHLDGLRLDATQQIFDRSGDHILAAVTRRVREAGGTRSTYVVAENEEQSARLLQAPGEGGFDLNAMWNDDFHHSAMVALTGRKEAYYSDHRGTPQEFISAAKWGFLFQGQWYSWQGRPRGTPALGLGPNRFVAFLQNHDQIANSLRGLRLHQLTSPGKYRAMTALLLLGPWTPMLFQGEEFGASRPFVYFADHHPELAALVAAGRKEFLAQFRSIAPAEGADFPADPGSEATFRSCQLDAAECNRDNPHYALHSDLIRLRREDPVFRHPQPKGVDGTVIGSEAFVLRFFGREHGDRLLVVNLGPDLELPSIPDPLIAPPAGCGWQLRWSSEDPRYGGGGTPRVEHRGWHVPGHATGVLASLAAITLEGEDVSQRPS